MTENKLKTNKNGTNKDAFRLSCYPKESLFMSITSEATKLGIKTSTYLLMILVDRHKNIQTLSEQGYGHTAD